MPNVRYLVHGTWDGTHQVIICCIMCKKYHSSNMHMLSKSGQYYFHRQLNMFSINRYNLLALFVQLCSHPFFCKWNVESEGIILALFGIFHDAKYLLFCSSLFSLHKPQSCPKICIIFTLYIYLNTHSMI